MAQDIPENLYARLSELIQTKIGLFFPQERWRDLERGVRAAALELGFEDTESCIKGLLGAPVTKVQLDTLVAHLTVGETFFLRDESHFNAMQEHILPGLFNARNNGGHAPRFWSAACCTGEEPYTIAMIIDRWRPLARGGDFSVLATDINSRFLEKARKGVYTNWSLRNAPNWMVEKYFAVQGKNSFAINPALKENIRFTNLNLVDPVYPSSVTHTEGMDVIFCRNVLMYFNQTLRETVIERLAWALNDGGWLFLGPSEAAFVEHPNLQHVRFPGAILFQKRASANQVQAAVQSWDQTPLRSQEKKAQAQETPPRPPPAFRGASPPVTPTAVQEKQASRPDKPPSREQLHDQALGLIEKGCYQDAADRLHQILARADKSIGLAPDARAMALLARAYANMGKLKDASLWGKRSVEADKLNPGHRYLLATINEEIGDSKAAADLLQSALFLDSRFVLAHFTLGNNVKKRGKINEAKRHFKNALALLLDLDPEAVIPHSGGLTAGRLTEIVRSMIVGD